MFYELSIAFRYLMRSKSHKGIVSFFTFISILCVTIGIAALIIVTSVMTGFEAELKKKVIGMYAHVTVTQNGGHGLRNWEVPADEAKLMPHVISAAPYVSGPVLMGSMRRGSLLYVLGSNPKLEKDVSDMEKFVTVGSPDITDSEIILGDQVARQRRTRIGDVIHLTSTATIQTPDGPKPIRMKYTVAGFFHSGNYEYDSSFGFITLHAAQQLFRLGSSVHAIKIKLDNVDKAADIKNMLQEELGPMYHVRTWIDKNKALFSAVQMEKRVMFIILLLISVVAALNIISTLVMVAFQKTKDIGILRSLGATRLSIGILFTLQGLLISLTGVLFGLTSGLLIAHNVDAISKFLEKHTGFSFFPPDVYYFDAIPSVVVPADVFLVSISAIGLCLLGSLIPAILAARLDPVNALRYE